MSILLSIVIGGRRRSSAVGSVDSGGSEAGGVAGGGAGAKTKYRVLVLGSSRVGKTSIISQFLYDQFSTKYKVHNQKCIYRYLFLTHFDKTKISRS